MEKTIKQLADELGVSKTAVNKKIDKLGLRKQLSQVGGKWFIPESVENTIKKSFSQATKTDNVSDNQSEIVSSLLKQLEEKDRQIQEKDRQLEQVLKSLDQAQQLQAISEQKLKLIEQKQSEEKEDDDESIKKKWWKIW